MKRNPLYLSRGERLALCLLTAVAALFGWWMTGTEKRPEPVALSPAAQHQVDSFLKTVVRDSFRTRPATHSPFPFDPNRADSQTLLRLGLRTPQIRNLLKYRRRGGTFRSADDLARLYGLTPGEFERLRPYVRIGNVAAETAKTRRDTLVRHTDKLPAGSIIDLGRADSATLCRIPGIGPYRAKSILRYAERLGGFVSTTQLNEIEGLPTDIDRWFFLKDTCIRKLPLNEAGFRELLRHPYLSYEQVKTLLRHRDKYGPLHDLRQLSLYPEFTNEHLQRLKPYVAF